jgi:hypothetical protein
MMRFKRKGFQILTLVIMFLLIYPGNLAAKKKGAHLVINKQDGQVIEGELLRVKENSLLVMTSAAGNGVTIDINEIIKIRIKKKSGAVKGALIGGLIVGAGGGALSYMIVTADNEARFGDVAIGFAAGATIGALLGAGTGAILSSGYKKIQVKGKSPSQIEKILKKLKKRARFKD